MLCSLPGTGYAIPAFSLGFTIKNALQANPRVAFCVANPPISSISVLLTAHARILPLPISGWSGRSGQGGLGGLGGQGLGLGLSLGGLGLGG